MKNLQIKLAVGLGEFGALLQARVKRLVREDRGDVPGWVLITVMTAGLVVGIWSIAGPQLKTVLTRALHSVTAP